jgi:hypothetical protein
VAGVLESNGARRGDTYRTELTGKFTASCQSTGEQCHLYEDSFDCESGILRGTLNVRLVE